MTKSILFWRVKLYSFFNTFAAQLFFAWLYFMWALIFVRSRLLVQTTSFIMVIVGVKPTIWVHFRFAKSNSHLRIEIQLKIQIFIRILIGLLLPMELLRDNFSGCFFKRTVGSEFNFRRFCRLICWLSIVKSLKSGLVCIVIFLVFKKSLLLEILFKFFNFVYF